MAITQEVNIEMLEKLADGNFKIKYPKTKAENIIDLARYATTTGSANTYVANIPGISNLVAGLRVTVKINVANTGDSTLNVSGLGSKSIRKSGGATLSSGNLKAGGVYSLVYDGTNFQLQGEGGEYGTALASDVLSPKTIGTESGIIAGTMPNRGRQISRVTTRSGRQAIQKGYHDGTGYIDYDDPNHIADNIRDGVEIAGVRGSFRGDIEYAPGSWISGPMRESLNATVYSWQGSKEMGRLTAQLNGSIMVLTSMTINDGSEGRVELYKNNVLIGTSNTEAEKRDTIKVSKGDVIKGITYFTKGDGGTVVGRLRLTYRVAIVDEENHYFMQN